MQSDGASAGRIRPGAPERARPALAVYVTRVSPNARGESTEQRERDAAGVTRGEWSVMIDRIAEPWGPRTPYAPGGSNGNWPVRVDQFLEGDLTEADIDRWVQSAVDPALQRRCDSISRSRAGASSVCAAGPSDRVNHGRLDPEGPVRLAGQQLAGSPDPPAGPRRAASSSRATGTRRWAASSSTSQELLRRARRLGSIRLLHERPALPRGVLHARRDRQGRYRHAAHGRQHPAVHRHRRGGAQGELSAPTASPARTPTSTTATRSPCGVTTSPRRRRCCGCGCSTAARGTDPPRMLAVDPAADAGGARGRRPPRHPRNGTNLALMNALLREMIEHGWYDAAYVDAHTIGFEELERGGRRLHAGAGRGDLRRPRARRSARPRELLGTRERLLSTVLQGFYQSNQATAAAVPGQQHAPAARHDRPARARACCR